ncbi:MAG TPA: cation-transporting P-type ATPase [Methylomirabilota bacterium]|nr:cation-transporting P-type ATPase [Methylomirabilota bacterium]
MTPAAAATAPAVAPPAWHAMSAAEAASLLRTSVETGLTAEEAARRLAGLGENRVGDVPERSLWRLALDQFRSIVVLLLLAATLVAAFFGDTLEALAILVALVLNAAIGFGTEWRARVSLARLRDLTVPHALVRRDGMVAKVRSAQLVPGDIIVLEAGSHVPADARLVDAVALRADESALTGESVSVDKSAHAIVDRNAPIAERTTVVYLGTIISAGRGLALVTATGVASELGRIGQLVGLAGDRTTPLERQVEVLGRRLVVVALAISAFVGLIGIIRGLAAGLMIETAISLAIAAIPEGLPAITAVALAAGLWRLARAGALVRRLPAVETLGSTTVICADKTGTMTENRMTVVRIHASGRTQALEEAMSDRAQRGAVVQLLTVAALVNDAVIERRGDQPRRLHGDPTETALLQAALEVGLDPERLARAWPRQHETPFDATTRFMATWNDAPDGTQALLVKGAPAVVVERSAWIHDGDGRRRLSTDERAHVLEVNRDLAALGLRVLAVAWRPACNGDRRVGDLTFLGFVALEDPVRAGVRDAIARCHEAGIITIMLTGDQRQTAEAVGRQLGLSADAVRSRVSPEQKFALIEQLQREGHVVAMTGDGINDAPALARADIGIAMGRHGTDVAREAADIVLTDDNFPTIVRAIEEGRVIYANLQKVIRFLFSCNLSEIVLILAAIAAGLPAPLLPLQILWINLVTDIVPAVALIRDPAEPGIMRRPPHARGTALVSWRAGGGMMLEGMLLSAGALSAYVWGIWHAGIGAEAGTLAFLTLVLLHPFQALNCRSQTAVWWQLPSNRLIWASAIILAAVQWLAIAPTPLAAILKTVPLSAADWLAATACAVWPVAGMQLVKWARATRVASLTGTPGTDTEPRARARPGDRGRRRAARTSRSLDG